MKLDTASNGRKVGKSETKREKWEGEREDRDKRINSIEALGYDQLFSKRGSQAKPE